MIGQLTSTSGKWMVRKLRNKSSGNSFVIEGRTEAGAGLGMDRSPASVRIMIVSSKSSHRE